MCMCHFPSFTFCIFKIFLFCKCIALTIGNKLVFGKTLKKKENNHDIKYIYMLFFLNSELADLKIMYKCILTSLEINLW